MVEPDGSRASLNSFQRQAARSFCEATMPLMNSTMTSTARLRKIQRTESAILKCCRAKATQSVFVVIGSVNSISQTIRGDGRVWAVFGDRSTTTKNPPFHPSFAVDRDAVSPAFSEREIDLESSFFRRYKSPGRL
jgi:hypothetical protein